MQYSDLFFGIIWKFCRGVTRGVSLDFSYEHGVRIFVKTLLGVSFRRKNEDNKTTSTENEVKLFTLYLNGD
jgi:hypothetical protein